MKVEPTKRGILGKIARIYNPLGVVAPVTLEGTLLNQDTCEAKVSWDAQLPIEPARDWLQWEQRLPQIMVSWEYDSKSAGALLGAVTKKTDQRRLTNLVTGVGHSEHKHFPAPHPGTFQGTELRDKYNFKLLVWTM